MVKVKLLKRYSQWDKGDVIEVCKNDAHALIDQKIGKLFVGYENKMMEPEKEVKGYKTKWR